MIPFHLPFKAKLEREYLLEVSQNNQKSGNGDFYKKCLQQIQDEFDFRFGIFTNSCTDALELAAILLDIKPGDEVILPSYTFVSTANAFLLRGATLVFCDSEEDNPNMDVQQLKARITDKTKAVVVVHYGGRSCDMPMLMALAEQYGFYVVEDAAQCIGATEPHWIQTKEPFIALDKINKSSVNFLGTRGHLSAFSFHDTKNIHCGEGGLLLVNDAKFRDRADIMKDKGTNRSKYLRGEVDKYTWVDLGSSYLPSEYNMAVLLAQLKEWKNVTHRRQQYWGIYNQYFQKLPNLLTPQNPGNGHNFYLVFPNQDKREEFSQLMLQHNIQTAFHYQPLHQSKMAFQLGLQVNLPHAEKFGNGLLRLPLYPQLSEQEIHTIAQTCLEILSNHSELMVWSN